MSQDIFAPIHSIFSLFFMFTLACYVQSKLYLTKVTSSSCNLYVCKHQYQLTRLHSHSLLQTITVKHDTVVVLRQPSGKFHNDGCYTRQQCGARHTGRAKKKKKRYERSKHCNIVFIARNVRDPVKTINLS